MGRCVILLSVFAISALGCWTDVRPAPPDLPPREDGEGTQPEGKAAAPATSPTASVVPEISTEELEPPLPTIQFVDTAGTSEANVKRWFANMPGHLRRCKGLQGNKITVYVSARDGDVYASLDETDADAGATSCVLETVAFELDNAYTTSTSPSERPNTVESILILNW